MSEVNNLKIQLTNIQAEGQTLSDVESFELCDLMATCEEAKESTNKKRNEMASNYHYLVLIFSAYEALRQSGFIKLPTRTPLEFSHFTKSTTGIPSETKKRKKWTVSRGLEILAGYATNSITADFLYPIIWKAVLYVEKCAKLKVLCITCDGASSNMKFFKLHDDDRNDKSYYTMPYKNSRRLGTNNKNICWRHFVRLYEEHCQASVYSPCPKLTHAHVNLNAFSIMEAYLAAKVISGTVANTLEHTYREEVEETVVFLKKL
ncbi:hypothetical protein MAR_019473 [Mya arenaria]|uniref:Transposase n=1 Tax=Mya arenaria TaxID=6604 RepID=A0ABY7E4H3_MYAAR|nr:hypothetical protein MAR_019473 [Mya arenaria]